GLGFQTEDEQAVLRLVLVSRLLGNGAFDLGKIDATGWSYTDRQCQQRGEEDGGSHGRSFFEESKTHDPEREGVTPAEAGVVSTARVRLVYLTRGNGRGGCSTPLLPAAVPSRFACRPWP